MNSNPESQRLPDGAQFNIKEYAPLIRKENDSHNSQLRFRIVKRRTITNKIITELDIREYVMSETGFRYTKKGIAFELIELDTVINNLIQAKTDLTELWNQHKKSNQES